MAFMFYVVGLRMLVGLGSADADPNVPVNPQSAKMWGIAAFVGVVFIFVVPHTLEPVIGIYTSSIFDAIGLHHFLAFALAGAVAWYLISAKQRLGQIGRAIADPIIIAVTALSLQHLWELLNESWKVIDVVPAIGEGVEKIFLVVAGGALIFGAWRLLSFARA